MYTLCTRPPAGWTQRAGPDVRFVGYYHTSDGAADSLHDGQCNAVQRKAEPLTNEEHIPEQLVLRAGLEPATAALSARCSTD